MPMLTRPLTREEVEELTGHLYKTLPIKWEELFGPKYQTVRYRAALDRVDYEHPEVFYGLGPESPSDCVWMVPGVTNGR